MNIKPIHHSSNNFNNNQNKVNINKPTQMVDDSFSKVLKEAIEKSRDIKVELTPQQKLAIDGLKLNDEEIILLKSFL